MCCNNCNDPVCQCTDGIDGKNIWTLTTANYTQPNIGANVQISTDSTLQFSNQGFGVGQKIFIEDGGYYDVVSIDSLTQMTIQNLGYTGNAIPTLVIGSGAKVSPGGVKGVDGSAGADGTAVLSADHTTSTSVGFSAQVLKTYTVAADTLNENGDALVVRSRITVSSPNGTFKLPKIIVDGNDTISTLDTSVNTKYFELYSYISRVSSTSIMVESSIMYLQDSAAETAYFGIPIGLTNGSVSSNNTLTVADLSANSFDIEIGVTTVNPTVMTCDYLIIEKLEKV